MQKIGTSYTEEDRLICETIGKKNKAVYGVALAGYNPAIGEFVIVAKDNDKVETLWRIVQGPDENLDMQHASRVKITKSDK